MILGKREARKGAKVKGAAKVQASASADERPIALKQYGLILEPVITEKASTLAGKEGSSVIALRVQRGTTKDEIKSAVERVFKVEVAAVRTINVMGKVKRSGRTAGRRASSKKAYVRLKPGQSIDLVEGI